MIIINGLFHLISSVRSIVYLHSGGCFMKGINAEYFLNCLPQKNSNKLCYGTPLFCTLLLNLLALSLPFASQKKVSTSCPTQRFEHSHFENYSKTLQTFSFCSCSTCEYKSSSVIFLVRFGSQKFVCTGFIRIRNNYILKKKIKIKITCF